MLSTNFKLTQSLCRLLACRLTKNSNFLPINHTRKWKLLSGTSRVLTTPVENLKLTLLRSSSMSSRIRVISFISKSYKYSRQSKWLNSTHYFLFCQIWLVYTRWSNSIKLLTVLVIKHNCPLFPSQTISNIISKSAHSILLTNISESFLPFIMAKVINKRNSPSLEKTQCPLNSCF